MFWPASAMAMIIPVSCCGKKPFGITTYKIAGETDGAEHHHQRDEAVPQHDFEPAFIRMQEAVETGFE